MQYISMYLRTYLLIFRKEGIIRKRVSEVSKNAEILRVFPKIMYQNSKFLHFTKKYTH